jgi:hypothetical protein
MTEPSRGVVVPAVPPRPPQLTLIGSSIRPGDSADPSAPIFELGAEQLALLPDDLRAELMARKGEAWVRGLTYAPENHYPAEVRDGCDFTSVDLPALPAPLNLALTAKPAQGTLAAGTYEYRVTAKNANGETTALPKVEITTVSEGGVLLEWHPVADGVQYVIYGRSGTLHKITTVGPFDLDQAVQWLDNGSLTPGAVVVPTSNTTGGAGNYSNLPIVEYVPFLVVSEDWCSSFGFEERDFKGRALRLLDNATPQAVEKEFWNGALGTAKSYPNNYLMKEGKVENLTPGTVPSVERGLAILQDALAQCGFGGQGMLHVQPQTTSSLLKVRRVGPLLYDIFDNIVVPGTGYPGTGPGGAAPGAGKAFIGASDLVMTRTEKDGTVFPDSFSEAFDWGQASQPNTIRFRAQRFAAAYADFACQFCCEVQLPA